LLYPSPPRHWFYCLALALLALPVSAWGRENLLAGSLALRQEYDSNVNLSADQPSSAWYSVLAPGLDLTSRGRTDLLQLRYNLGIRYNHSSGGDTLDHDFLLRGESELSPRWRAEISNRFYLSDDSDFAGEPIPEVDPELSAGRERERFRLNTFAFSSDYRFGPRGTMGLGYENRILRHQSGTRDDYTRHHPSLNLGYRFNRQWSAEAGYGYIKGDFDRGDDLETHDLSLGLNYQATSRDQLSLGYGFNDTAYQGLTPDYRLHSFSSGWDRRFSPHANLVARVGLVKVDRASGADGSFFSFALDLNRQLQRGSLSIGGRGGIDELQFAGGDEGDLSRYQQVQAAGRYQLRQGLAGELDLSLRRNEFIDRPGPNREWIYQAGCGLSYDLSRNYRLATRYRYKELDAEGGDDYRDHRLLLELRMVHDLMKW